MRFLFTFLFVSSAIICQAQSRNFWFGVNGTAQFNTFEYMTGILVQGQGEGAPKANWTGFGVSARMENESKWSFLMGVNYAMESFNVEFVFTPTQPNDPFIPVTTEVIYSYLDIPLEASYQITKDAKFEFLAFGGLNYSALLTTQEDSKMMDDSEKETTYFGEYKPVSLLQLKMGVQARYSFADQFRVSLNPYVGYGLIQNTETYGKKEPFAYGFTLLLEYGRGKTSSSE